MKTIIYNLCLLFLLFPASNFAKAGTGEFDGRHTEEKKIQKNYEVSPHALLEVENKYGEIDLTTWNQNKVEIVVTLRANGNDKEAVLKRLDELDVVFQHSPNRISAESYLETSRGSFLSWITGGSSNVNVEINYKIKAPANIHVNLENDYGSINIDRLEGNADISIDYGQLFIGELLGEDNEIEMDYTRNSQIGYIKNGHIDADYSEYLIEEAGVLRLSADYSKTRIQKVEHLDFSCDYGSIEVGLVKNIRGNGDYLSTTVDSVYETLDLNLDYGSATIRRMMKSLENFNIHSDYTTLKIGYLPDSPWRYSLNSSYANIKGLEGENFNHQKQHQSGSKRYYEGHHLSNSGAMVTIEASYGGINFTQANQQL